MTSEPRAAGEPEPVSEPVSEPGPEQPDLRLSNAERAAVSRALAVHGESGRLSADELEDRQVIAARAVAWSEVAPLFADLPEPHPRPGDLPPEPADPEDVASDVATPEPVTGDVARWPRRPGPLLPRSSHKPVLALTTFAALIAFFGTDNWLWFLAIPIVRTLITWGEDDD